MKILVIGSLALSIFASQAMAGESIVIQSLPYSKKCLEQYRSIEGCIIGLVEMNQKLTKERNGFAERVIALELRIADAPPKPREKPMVKVMSDSRSAVVHHCKPGRTWLPKKGCGRWHD